MKLYTRTPAGTGLGINVLFTGHIEESDGKVRRVEVMLPSGCDRVVGYTIDPLPKTPLGDQLLWADPGDLCGPDGASLSHEALRAEAARVRERLRYEATRGPLPEDWP